MLSSISYRMILVGSITRTMLETKKMNRMVKQAKLNSRRTGTKLKIGVELPSSWNYAEHLDKEKKKTSVEECYRCIVDPAT